MFGPWLVWLSGLSDSLRSNESSVHFPVRAHACEVGHVPSKGSVRGNYTLMFHSLSPFLPLSLKINKILKRNNMFNIFLSTFY